MRFRRFSDSVFFAFGDRGFRRVLLTVDILRAMNSSSVGFWNVGAKGAFFDFCIDEEW